MFTPESRVSARPDVLFTQIDGETVLLGADAGIYYGLNEVGTVIWNCIQSGGSLADIRDAVTVAFDINADTAWQDLTALLLELQSEHLIGDTAS